MNRLATSALAAVLLAIATPSVSAQTMTLTVSYSPATYQDVYEQIASRFMAENPGIEIELQAAANYDELTQTTLRAAITGTLPDVSHQGMAGMRIYVDQGIALPLDPFIAAEPDWERLGYSASVAEMGRIGGAVYGIPFAISTPTLFYNADLVRRAGGDPDALPETWPEIIDLAERIDALGPDILGIYYDYGASSAFAWQTLVFSQGGDMLSADETDVAFDGPEGRWAFDLLQRFGAAGQVDMSRQQARQTFAAGGLGIYKNASSLLTRFLTQAEGQFEVVVQPVPVPAPDGRLPVGGNAAMMFATEPERQQAAWDYILFATGPVGQTIMVQETGYVPVNTLPVDDPAYLGAFYSDNPQYRIPVEQMPVMSNWYAFPGENSVRITEIIRDAMQDVVTLREQPDTAMDRLVAEVEALLPD